MSELRVRDNTGNWVNVCDREISFFDPVSNTFKKFKSGDTIWDGTSWVTITCPVLTWVAGDYTCELSTDLTITGFSAPYYSIVVAGKIYVSNYYSGNLSIVDNTNTIIGNIYSGFDYPTTGRALRNIVKHPTANRILSVTSAGSVNSYIITFDLTTGTTLPYFDIGYQRVREIQLVPLTNLMGIVTDGGGSARFYNINSFVEDTSFTLSVPTNDCWFINFNATGSKAYVLRRYGYVNIYDMTTHSLLTTLDCSTVHTSGGSVFSECQRYANKLYITNNSDNSVYIIDMDTDTITRKLIGAVPSFSKAIPELNKLFVSTTTGTVLGYDLDTLDPTDNITLGIGSVPLGDFVYFGGYLYVTYLGSPQTGSPGNILYRIGSGVRTGKKFILDIWEMADGVPTGNTHDNLSTNPSIGLPYFPPETGSLDCV